MKSVFPNPRKANEDGLLCVGGDFSVELLKDAYYHGIFPWPHEGYPLLWFSPKERGVVKFDNLHVSRSLVRAMRRSNYRFTVDQAFQRVIHGCAKAPRKGQKGTWITAGLEDGYIKLHRAGDAHSLECWDNETLIGGIYGVYIGGVFCAESMFGLRDNVSKMCFVKLIEHLSSMGLTWMDIQMLTPASKSLGGELVSQEVYLGWLDTAHRRKIPAWQKIGEINDKAP